MCLLAAWHFLSSLQKGAEKKLRKGGGADAHPAESFQIQIAKKIRDRAREPI